MAKIGIIGQGFVGNAMKEKFKLSDDVYTYDKYNEDKCREYINNNKTSMNIGLTDIVEKCEFIFVCVPTPMYEDGECDTRIVESVLSEIDVIANKLQKMVYPIIKSTIPPGSTRGFNKKYENIEVAFCPEFLTEKNAVLDFQNQSRIIIGFDGNIKIAKKIRNIFDKHFPQSIKVLLRTEEAEMTKYMTNLFLSTKVSFFNDMYDFCNEFGINYQKVSEATLLDKRIGNSHHQVPGHDGDRGFGGHCVPGDTGILTENGIMEIEKLWSENELNSQKPKIMSMDHLGENFELKDIKEFTKNDFDGDLIVIEHDNGEFKCTPEHLIPVNRNGNIEIVQAQNILITDDIYINQRALSDMVEKMRDIKISKIKSIRTEKFSGPVYNMELISENVHDDLYWTDNNGFVSHNCFPKDVNAILSMARKNDLKIPTLDGAWETNKKVRKNKDWEQMKGRAVSKRDKPFKNQTNI